MTSHTALIEGDFDAQGAYGPTILLVLVNVDGVRLLCSTFDRLAEAVSGTTVGLHNQPGVSLRAAIHELNLCVVDERPRRHLVRTASGGFRWCCTPDEWREASLLIEPLFQEPGHQYLTSEIEDDALVEVSYGEEHNGFQAR